MMHAAPAHDACLVWRCCLGVGCNPQLCVYRKDMLDEALLRPGRLEVQVEIGLADEKGRHQILQVGQLA